MTSAAPPPTSPTGGEDHGSAHLSGIALMLIAICVFSLGDALGKALVATYPVGQLLFLRGLAALILLSPLAISQRTAFRRIENKRLHALRMFFSTADVAAFFVAAIYLPLTDIITYYLAAPIFVTALSGLILRETVGWRRWSAVAVGFCGVLIALRPSAETITWPALIALAGSLSFAGLMIVTRLLRGTPEIVLATTQIAATFLCGAVASTVAWTSPGLADLGLFGLAGIITISALFCLNRALRLAPASMVVPYQYTMIVWAVIFGYAVFGDAPEPATLAGAAIIITAGLYIFLREQALGRAAISPEPPA